jgi:2,3-bisphosphoglycerate-dependent phosphoglycerate mutase
VRPSRAARALVLLRHGHSAGNAANSFTGWLDVPLTARGEAGAAQAGQLLVAHDCVPAVVHASVLTRAVRTARIVADAVAASGAARPEVRYSWRLNERHYGALQGRGRAEVRAEFGAERAAWWRRSYRGSPPPLSRDDPSHPRFDPRYVDLPAASLPAAESLADVHARLEPYWPVLAADLRAGHPVLVVAHSNSLRALCLRLDALEEHEVEHLDLPTGVPLRYLLDPVSLRPLTRGGDYLDPEAARAGIAEVVAQGQAGEG